MKELAKGRFFEKKKKKWSCGSCPVSHVCEELFCHCSPSLNHRGREPPEQIQRSIWRCDWLDPWEVTSPQGETAKTVSLSTLSHIIDHAFLIHWASPIPRVNWQQAIKNTTNWIVSWGIFGLRPCCQSCLDLTVTSSVTYNDDKILAGWQLRDWLQLNQSLHCSALL